MADAKEILISLAPDHLEEVIRRAVEFRTRVNKNLQKFFEFILERFIFINGFRTPLTAPDHLLCLEIKRLLKKNLASNHWPKQFLRCGWNPIRNCARLSRTFSATNRLIFLT
ncbi:MAG: hypothetical protein K6T55_09070 [Syntrophobacterales bacterium]|nr:hypothetical protein [Syntrophobacterales bacterium]